MCVTCPAATPGTRTELLGGSGSGTRWEGLHVFSPGAEEAAGLIRNQRESPGSQVGVGVVGAAGETLSLWGGLPAFLSWDPQPSWVLFPISLHSKSSRRCLPEYPKRQVLAAAGRGRPPRDFLRFELSQSPAPPRVLPGVPQAPLHGAESRPHPSQKHWVNLNIC